MKILRVLIFVCFFLLFSAFPVIAQEGEEIPAGFGGDQEVIDNLDEGVDESTIEQEVLSEDNSDSEDNSNEFVTGVAVGVGFGGIVGIILGWLFKDKIV